MNENAIQQQPTAAMRETPEAALRYARVIHRWRVLIILIGAVIGVLGAIGLNRVIFDPDVLVYYDRQMPERQALEAIEDRFGMTNEAVFVLRSREGSLLDPARLEAIRFLHEGARGLPGVLNVRSVLSLAGGSQFAATSEAIAALRDALQRAGRAGRAVISEDETVAAVAAIVPRNSRNDIDVIGAAQAVRKLQAEARQRCPAIEVLMTGRLMMDNAFLVDGQDETFFYAGVQIAVLALVLLVTSARA
jgi:predicted RND superfamily exporter protein